MFIVSSAQRGIRRLAIAIACTFSSFLFSQSARSQNSTVDLPQIDVTASRVGSGGIVGASSSVITAQDIERSPAQSLPDILATQAGIQVFHSTGGPIGVNDTVDLRGFGAFAQSNVLILVNGRRYQDFDSQGFDFSTIPLNSIERVEITRGNSGAVLYGDGAIGGVINIVTKTATGSAFSGRVEGAVGSYGFSESRLSAGMTSVPWSAAVFGNAVTARGYRQNSELRQENLTSKFNYNSQQFSAYLNIAGDRQRQNLPGNLYNVPVIYPITLDTPRASVFPFDWANKQDFNATTGFVMPLWVDSKLIVDGGVRRKFQQANFFNYFPPPAFSFDPTSMAPMNYVNTVMTTSSLTPRLEMSYGAFGVQNQLLTGVDAYNTQYDSDRELSAGQIPIHHYNIRQTSVAFYAMNKTAVLPQVDVSAGGRVQRSTIKARDAYDATFDSNAGFYTTDPQAPPLDTSEWQYAAHLGAEYRIAPAFALFGRVARAFRLPNADERVGAGSPFSATMPANFGLKTQTSHDVEGGFRVSMARFSYQSSVYLMDLNNEIHFNPTLFLNINLDPTRRQGWENTASYQLTEAVRLRGGVSYTRATFREGPFAGNDIPLVSRWTGNVGVSWDIVKKLAVLDVNTRFWGPRRMDNDQPNVQPLIPANATVDVRLGGEYDRFFWSATVLNLFNVNYFDYSIASASAIGTYAAFPLPGRTFMLRGGATF